MREFTKVAVSFSVELSNPTTTQTVIDGIQNLILNARNLFHKVKEVVINKLKL